MQIESFTQHIQPILIAIREAGGRPLIVGGAVRDYVMGQPPKDIDIEVYGLPAQQLAEILASFGRVDAVGQSFGILKVRLADGREVDFSLPRRESKVGSGHRGFLAEPDSSMTPRDAAARRDFTWNAMAITPEGELLDFFGGMNDLHAGILRHTTEAFAEDPLRVLRAMQFAARFDMRLAPETAELCRRLLPEASTLAVERIWSEWHKWAIKGQRPSAGMRVLRATGWLTLYPELEALVNCPQDHRFHPEGDVWVHTLHVVDAAAAIAKRNQLEDEQRAILIFSALCHDFGKPATTSHDPDGYIRSRGHAHVGVRPAENFLQRIGCFRSIATNVVPLVREHMAHLGAKLSARVVRRLAVRLTPATIEQWGWLIEADHSGRPPLPPGNPSAPFVELAHTLGVAHGRPAPILQGRDLIAHGMAPGPKLGMLLRRAYNAQIEGAFETKADALDWIQRSGLWPKVTDT